MQYETVLLERRDEVGILTFNRPERMNAVNNQMAYELCEALDELNNDGTVSAIVMTGAGRSFCAGADFSRFEDAIRRSDGEVIEIKQPRFWWLDQVRDSKPIVVAVNGPSIGAGLTRILPCDVRIASERAAFSMRFVKVGLVPEIGSTQILAQIVGLQAAADLMFSGRTIDAQEALRLGLVLRVVEHERVLDEAIRLAQDYAENGPNTILEAKRLLYSNYMEADLREVVERERVAINKRYGSPEQREAVAAFREKRKPDFRSLTR